MLKNVSKGFSRFYKQKPEVTKAIIGGALLGVADIGWQVSEHDEDSASNMTLDLRRLAVGVSGGIVGGVLGHRGLKYLDKRAMKLFPPPFAFESKAWLYKMGLGQIIYGTIVMSFDNANRLLRPKGAEKLDLENRAKQVGVMCAAAALGFKFVPLESQFTFFLVSHLASGVIVEWYDSAWVRASKESGVGVL